MGAGASAAETSEYIRDQGDAYAGYADAMLVNGVDGALIADVIDAGDSETQETFDTLGVSNKLHRRKLMLGARERFQATLAAQDTGTCVVPVTAAAAERRGTLMMPYDVFVSHAKRRDSS